MQKIFDLSGKTAVVTGGSRGLGLAVAQGLTNAGARVAIVARHPPVETVAQHAFFPADLVEAAARAGLMDRIAAEIGGLDIFFHCAGQQVRSPAVEFPLPEWNAILELHLTAALDLSQQAARRMLPQGSGKIVLMSSIMAFEGGLYVPAYAAAKHAVTGLVKSLCNEWAAAGINVNALAPGYFDAGIGSEVLHDPVRSPRILSRIPAGRAGVPEELEGAAVFLASDASRYVHGHTLVVDGGWLAR